MKTLVVDNFATMLNIVCNLLRQLGFENIQEADDGSTALEKLKYEIFDFVISGWNMPEVSGLELQKSVGGDAKLKDLPFMIVTAEGLKKILLPLFKQGQTIIL